MAKRFLRRRIYKSDGRPRIAVQAVLWSVDRNSKQDVDTTDDTPGEEGLVSFNTTNIPEGFYEIRYYGDGIKATRRDKDGSIVFEDPITPWELNIFILAYADTEPPDAPLWDDPAITNEDDGGLTLHWLTVVDPSSGLDGYSVFRVKPDYVIHGEGTYTGAGVFTDDEDPGWTINEHDSNTFIANYAADSGNSTDVGPGYLEDTGQTWGVDDWIYHVLKDSIGKFFPIISNDVNTLTVIGTPTAGAYTIEFADAYTILSNTSNTVTVDLTGKTAPEDGRYTIVTGTEPAETAYESLYDTEDETQLTYTDRELSHQHLYYYRLKAHDTAGNESAFSESRYGISNDIIGPAIIHKLKAIAGLGSVSLTWDPPLVFEPLHYNIIYCDIPVVGPPQTDEANLVWKNPFSSTYYGPSGTYSGGGIWTDNGTPNWTTDEHVGRLLIDATTPIPLRFEITANTSNTLTLDLTPGTPTSGEFHIIGDTTVPNGTAGVEDDMAVSYTEYYVDYGVFAEVSELERRVYLVRAVDEANNYGPWQQTYEYTPNVDVSGYQPGDGIPPTPPVLYDTIANGGYSYADESGNVRLRWKASSSVDRNGYRIFIKFNSSAEEWYIKTEIPAIETDEADDGWIEGTGIMQSNAFYDSTASWTPGLDNAGGEHAWHTLHFTDPAIDKRFVISHNTGKHLYLIPGQGIKPSGNQPYRIIPDVQEWEVTNIRDNGEYKFMLRTVDNTNMVSADSNVITVNVNDTVGPDAPNKPNVASLRGGVLISWIDVPDWGNNFSLTPIDSNTVKITDLSGAKNWTPNEWIGYHLISPNRSNPRIKKSYLIIDNGSSWIKIRLTGNDTIADLSLLVYSLTKESILHNREYKYELWRSPHDSAWDFNGDPEYHPITNNCELVDRMFMSKNGYFYTQYRDWDYTEDGSIPLEATVWESSATGIDPYLPDDGQEAGKVYYAIKAVDEDDNISNFSPISDWVKANLVYEREVGGVIDFDHYHFLYSGKKMPTVPPQWMADWLANDLAGLEDPLDDPTISQSLLPHEGQDGTNFFPLGIVHLQTEDRFAEDIEIYWRQYIADQQNPPHAIDFAPQILRIPLTAVWSGYYVIWTINYHVILQNTIKGYHYEFKTRVIDEFGNKSEWNPPPGFGSYGTDWLRFYCGIDLNPMFPFVTSRLLTTSAWDHYP
jgi:hypothetical protein